MSAWRIEQSGASGIFPVEIPLASRQSDRKVDMVHRQVDREAGVQAKSFASTTCSCSAIGPRIPRPDAINELRLLQSNLMKQVRSRDAWRRRLALKVLVQTAVLLARLVKPGGISDCYQQECAALRESLCVELLLVAGPSNRLNLLSSRCSG